MNDIHIPVLADEICQWLVQKPDGTYVDCTLGMGGTSLRILESSGSNANIVGLDRDPEALAIAEKNLEKFCSQVKIFCGDYSHIVDKIYQAGLKTVDGVIFDLGVSSLQLDKPERGFSFASDGPLDMRMNQTQGPTAADLVKVLPERELADLLFAYGEERFSRRIARAIVEARKSYALETTQALVAVIKGAVPHAYRKGRIHCATRTFQALRIRVNQELELLQPALEAAVSVLKEGGRLCVVAFHSLEDRVVKRTFRALAGNDHPSIKILTKRPVTATQQEIQQNPRARSAKLRVAQRVAEGANP